MWFRSLPCGQRGFRQNCVRGHSDPYMWPLEPPTLMPPVPAILRQLVQTAVSDRNEMVRCTIFQLLMESTSLDSALAQPTCVVQLFPGLGDSSWGVRSMAIKLIGRLGTQAVPTVEPVLESLLGQLLQQLEFSPESEFRQGRGVVWC